jgi:uncharacterized membrane protein
VIDPRFFVTGGGVMHSQARPTAERLGAFSDNVFAVIIAIKLLELKPPPRASFEALLPLWPTVVSYAVSYLFIANSLGKSSEKQLVKKIGT